MIPSPPWEKDAIGERGEGGANRRLVGSFAAKGKREMNLLEYVCENYGYSEFVANGMIMAGQVLVNDEACIWTKYQIKKKDRVRIRSEKKKYVTRAGNKLEKAIQCFRLDVKDVTAIDIGASNGGFTDCLLKHGAARVYAVDVAYGILDYSLRQDDRVVPVERVNARFLSQEHVPEQVDLIVSDVSFISLSKVITPNLKFLRQEGSVAMLFKPQFELDKELLGKNGIPRNDEDVTDAMNAFVGEMGKAGLYVCDIEKSPIKGTSGNTEYLLLGKKVEHPILTREQIAGCVGKK